MRRSIVGVGLVLGVLGIVSAEAAPPKPKANPAKDLPSLDADNLPAGTFSGTLVSVPGSDRMFTLKVTYPEVRLNPGAKMPNLRSAHARNMQQLLQQMNRAQRMPVHHGRHHNAFSDMMQMQQAYARSQQQMAQAVARAQQRELQLLQQDIKAIENMYQVVKATRNVDFQTDENLKVRIKDLPEQFDEKGNIKKYTAQEKAELKGKDKNLPGYESSPESLKVGQVVMVSLKAYKKTNPTPTLTTPAAGDKEKNAEKDKDADKDKDVARNNDTAKDKDKGKDKDKDKDADASVQHKMQVKLIVILQESEGGNSTTQPRKK